MKAASIISKRRVAIFDIDGTIFRSSLVIELTDALIQKGLFPLRARRIYAASYRRWLDRKDSYEKYIGDVVDAFGKNIRSVKRKDFTYVTKRVIAFHKNRVYRYTRDLLHELKRKHYFLIAISHSPRDIVAAFAEDAGFDKIYGRIYEVGKNGKFTGSVLCTDLINDKGGILKRAVAKEKLSLAHSIGVGDTETDISFLNLVEHPICFNPNKKLYAVAKKKGWDIVVERKDVIYHV